MNNENFLVKQYLLAQKIMRVEEEKSLAGIYQMLVSTNGNYKNLARQSMDTVRMLEESVEMSYEMLHQKHSSYPEIRAEYYQIIESIKENTAQIEYPDNVVSRK